MSTLGRYSQFDNVDDAHLLNMMIEERQRTIRERAKVFSNHILDIVIYGGLNILLSILFFVGYNNDSFHQEIEEKDSQCTDLLDCSRQLAIFHLVCSFIFILLPILCYLSAQKEDPKYFNFFKTCNLAISTLCFIAFIVLVGHSLSSLLQKEPCGYLRILFISYAAFSMCFIIGVIALVMINWIQCNNEPKKKPNSSETQPINQIRDQLKYGSTQQQN